MIFEFQRFYRALDEVRAARKSSWRRVARELGIGRSTLARMAQHRRPSADSLVILAAWAGLNPADFVIRHSYSEPAQNGLAAQRLIAS